MHSEVHDAFIEKLVARAERIKLGDPLDPSSEMGPLANPVQLTTVSGFVSRAIDQGANLVSGGSADETLGGLFYRPTILTEVLPEMELTQEEVFGPVLAVLPFDSEEEAIEVANGTPRVLN